MLLNSQAARKALTVIKHINIKGTRDILVCVI